MAGHISERVSVEQEPLRNEYKMIPEQVCEVSTDRSGGSN